MKGKNIVKMEDVARLAGVSSITVSRVLNRPEKVAESTRDRVLAAVEATGYTPNGVASSLATRRTRVIGALVPTITNSIFADTIDGLSDVLRPAGYQLLLGATGYSLAEETRLVGAMLAQRPAGLLATGLQHEAQAMALLRATDIPIVETWNVDGDPADMAVGFSNFRACYAMVEVLARQGARRIGFVSAPITANDRAEQRLSGYRDAVRKLGLDADPRLEREAKFSFHAGAEQLLELVGKRPRVEAIFFANDILAIGALFECQRRGIRVPDDLAVAGFDEVELAAQVNPGLTTVRIPRYGIGREAARMILRRLEGKTVDPRVVDLGFRIVERQSTHGASAG